MNGIILIPNNQVQNQEVDTEERRMDTNMVFFPIVLTSVVIPAEGCPYRSNTPGRIREHFIYQHWKDQLEINL